MATSASGNRHPSPVIAKSSAVTVSSGTLCELEEPSEAGAQRNLGPVEAQVDVPLGVPSREVGDDTMLVPLSDRDRTV